MFAPGELSPRVRNLAAGTVHRVWDWIVAVGAVGPDDAAARRFRAFGTRSMLAFPPGQRFHEHWIAIGSHTLVGPHVAMSVGMWNEELDPAAPPVLRIGDRVNIGRGSSLVARVGIEVGDDVTMAPGVYVTDHNHAYDDPDVPVARQWPRAEPVVIGPGCWLGTGAVVLPGTRLGRNVVVGANSVVRGDVPDHAVVAGVPARVVRRLVDGRWDPPVPPGDEAVPDAWPDR